MKRKKTRKVKIGNVVIGGGAPVAVQSMTNTRTKDIKATSAQIKKLEKAGCEIIRVSVPDMESAAAVKKIKKAINIPLVADIHYDYKLAIAALESGADKIRINPGNIGSEEKVKAVIDAAKKNKAAIRIGVNAGSLKKIQNPLALRRFGGRYKIRSLNKTAARMINDLMGHILFFEKNKFRDIVVSLKASDVMTALEAYRIYTTLRDYPVHIGITEAGTELGGLIKSSAGLAILLSEGIGDTMRVSLSADPVKEVFTAYRILDVLNMRKRGVEIISCPTCARTEINVIKLARDVEKMTMNIEKPVKVAVMGCSVNGPEEAKHADIGVTGSKKFGIIMKGGKIIKKVPKKELIKEFIKELNKIINEGNR